MSLLCKHGCTDQGPVCSGDSWGARNIVLDRSCGAPTDSMQPSPDYFGRLLDSFVLHAWTALSVDEIDIGWVLSYMRGLLCQLTRLI